MQSRDEVAIVGYACRLPGARDVGAFWRLLKDNRCSVSWITDSRFSTWNLYHPSTDQRGPGYPRVIGSAPDIGAFEFNAAGDEIFGNGFDDTSCGP